MDRYQRTSLEDTIAINVVAYSEDLLKRIIMVAATRNAYEVRTPGEWATLFRSELAKLG